MLIKILKSKLFHLYFIFVASLYLVYFFNYHKIISEWVLSDLLINYQGGFVRRGFLGELNYIIENFINIKKLFFIISIIFTIYFINLIFSFIMIKNFSKNNIFLFTLIFLSPATFLFYIYDVNALFRKDVFIIFSIVVHAFYIQINLNKPNLLLKYKKNLFYISILLSFVTLIQEVQFFMLPIHILLSFSILKNWKLLFSIYIFPFLTFLTIYIFKGDAIVVEKIRLSLENYPKYIIYAPYNSIHWLEGNINLVIGGFLKFFFKYSYFQAIQIIIVFFLSIILFWNIFKIGFKQFYIENKNKNLLNLKFINNHAYKFFYIPLFLFFIMGFDIGRAVHFLTMHIMCLFTIFVPKKNIFINKYGSLAWIFLISYLSLWYLPAGYVGLETIFKSGIMETFKMILSYFFHFISNFETLPEFIIKLSDKYLIFNVPNKF